MKRRAFLQKTGMASTAYWVPNFLSACAPSLELLKNHKKLVIIQLSGGNDGLNTVVPYRNDIYYKNRSNIGQRKETLLQVTDELGFHESLQGVMKLYDQGALSILHSVGYPNPSRSHFRATDIWHTASASNEYLQSGWAGRYLEKIIKKPIGGIEVDDTLSLLLKGKEMNGIATKNAKLFYETTQDPYFSNSTQFHADEHLSEHNLGYLYKTAINAQSSASYIYEKTKVYKGTAPYPKNVFGNQLKTISEFINSGLETQIYYASLGGFDTHANQVNSQKRLLRVYSEGITTFMEDLRTTGALKDTLVLTFSEFGRRLKQNAGKGTDHGAANLVFLMGDKLKHPGMYNEPNSLIDLDANGDIRYDIDFRDIYASLLKEWLQTDPETIIGGGFKTLGLV